MSVQTTQQGSGAQGSPTERLRAFAAPYAEGASSRVPLLRRFPGGPEPVFADAPDSDRGLGILLLAAALYRPGGDEAVAALLAELHARFGTDLFRLNRVPFERLQAAVEDAAADWDADERRRVPGILRSVCDFFFRAGSLRTLLTADDWEPCVARLATEILWMGAQSATRVKARRFFWLACSVPGLGATLGAARTFRWPPADGFLRFRNDQFGDAGAARRPGGRTPQERLDAMRDLAAAALPEAPWAVVTALDDYLRPFAGAGFACRVARGGCRGCPLALRCPAAPHFLPQEPARETPAGK